MEKNTDFIRNKEFHIVFKGYKPEEVDKFLDQLSLEFERIIKKNRELVESLDKQKFEGTVETDNDIKRIIQDALVSAHKVAEDIKSQAKKEAEEMLINQKLKGEKSLQDMKMKKIQIEESITLLQRRYEEFKSKINKEIEEMTVLLKNNLSRYSAMHGMIQHETVEYGYNDNEDIGAYKAEIDALVDSEDNTEDRTYKFYKNPNEIESKPLQNLLERNLKRVEKKDILETVDNFFPRNEKENDLYFDSSIPKRERKKIDIANPDIIEDFSNQTMINKIIGKFLIY